MPTAEEMISMLDLKPLPGEGGYYRETWILPSGSDRPAGTAILYLITPSSFSALHRLDADEIFHFYLGNPCEHLVISPDGELTSVILGPDVLSGQHVQSVVPKEHWQGTRLLEGGQWALIGTTMVPGYHQAGFELAHASDLQGLPSQTANAATRYLAEQA